jgi:hypothetical protein
MLRPEVAGDGDSEEIMRSRFITVALGAAFSALLAASLGLADDKKAATGPQGGGGGVSALYQIAGDAVDQDRKPIAGVAVMAGGHQAVTNGSGSFAMMVERRTASYVVHASKKGVEFNPADITVTSPAKEMQVKIHFRGKVAVAK